LVTDLGYGPVRYGYEMVRPDLENIPDLPLPEGLEVRPVKPEHYRLIWQALNEAFKDHWGSVEWREEWLEEWMESPTFNPDLWQVAWDGDQVAGTVLNFINHKENEEYDRKRGWTEYICVRRPWRRQGLAKALIARSLHVVKEQGMTEAALGVDTQNPNGALQLYEGMGFRPVKHYTTYRKPLD
jgi:GNAT superfamily N-acetyltransferase